MHNTTPELKRALAQQARRERAARIRRLRRRVAATAAATLVLATGVVAYDGSRGATTSTQASTTAVAQAPSVTSSAENDTITTQQS